MVKKMCESSSDCICITCTNNLGISNGRCSCCCGIWFKCRRDVVLNTMEIGDITITKYESYWYSVRNMRSVG